MFSTLQTEKNNAVDYVCAVWRGVLLMIVCNVQAIKQNLRHVHTDGRELCLENKDASKDICRLTTSETKGIFSANYVSMN